MKVQTLVVTDGHHSNISLTVLWLGELRLVYQRNLGALLLKPLLNPRRQELEERVYEWNRSRPSSGTHAAIYWLLTQRTDLPCSISVQTVLEAMQFEKPIQWDGAPADALAYPDMGTYASCLEHWCVADDEYWLLYCRRGGHPKHGQALCFNVQSGVLCTLWTHPYGTVGTLNEMRQWLASENGDRVLGESNAALGFYWLQSYGRDRLQAVQPVAQERVVYACFPCAAARPWLPLEHYAIGSELLQL